MIIIHLTFAELSKSVKFENTKKRSAVLSLKFLLIIVSNNNTFFFRSRPIQPPVSHRGNKEVSGDVYLCNICDKVIPCDYQTVHENSHKSNNKMNCGICNKKFTSMEFLEMHMNIHNLDKVSHYAFYPTWVPPKNG